MTNEEQQQLVNTNMPYKGSKPYTRFPVPHSGHIFPAYDLSTAYAESDVLVSMAKLKEHATAGVTLSIKNLFGITPTTIYGNKCSVGMKRLNSDHLLWGAHQNIGPSWCSHTTPKEIETL